MNSLVVSTLIYAALSATFRGIISVIDRKLFGHFQLNIRLTNLANNLLATLLISFIAIIKLSPQDIQNNIFNWNLCAFALLLQLTAYAFSNAFKHMKVHHVILASKGADLFIPFAILAFAGDWTLKNSLFSFASFFACLPLIFLKKSKAHIHYKAAFFIVLILTIQGGLSPILISKKSSGFDYWVGLTLGLIFWRSLWSLLFNGRNFSFRSGKINLRPVSLLLFLRSLLTIGAQLFLVLSIGNGLASLAWPILNSTGIFSLLLASFLLNEKASKPELLSMLFIVLVALFRALL